MKNTRVRKMVTASMLGVVGFVLMMLDFSVPIVPSFIKLDFSELASLLGAFALGPIWGAAVCLIKNVLNLIFHSNTGGIGELSNFLLGSALAIPAGMIYRKMRNRKGALIGAVVGSIISGVASIFINYYVTYPVYMQLFMPLEVILAAYQAILSTISGVTVTSLWQALIWFNMPFTIVKNLLSSAIVMLVYKKLSPILKGGTPKP